MDYTPTQRRILDLLSDGRFHSTAELMRCLNDDLTDKLTLRVHMHFLRNRLKPVGESIQARRQGSTLAWYQWIRVVRVE